MMLANNLYQAIQAHTQHDEDKIAIACDHASLTWRAFFDLINHYRDRFPIGDKQVVALAMPNSIDLPALFIAATSLGHTVQVFNSEWPNELIINTVERLTPDFIITANIDISGPDFISLTDFQNNSVIPKNEFVNTDTSLPFYTGFTSGSTGGPKGFVRTQQSWLDSFAADQEIFSFSENDTFIIPGSLAQSLGLYAALRGLYQGATTVLFSSFHPRRILNAIHTFSGSVIYATPIQIRALLDVQINAETVLPTIRLILSSGSKFPIDWQGDVLRYYPQSTFYEFYGTSELSYITTSIMHADKSTRNVGKPFSGVDLKILDADGNDLPVGDTGRIFVKSNFVFSGYAIANAQSSLEGCVFKGDHLNVGDTGYIDTDGDLHLVGRSDRMFLASGRNIFPEEVEAVMYSFPTLKHTAVFGEADPKRENRLAAVLLESEMISVRELLSWCRKKLPAYLVPQAFYQIQVWPYTSSHKTDLLKLESDLRAGLLEKLP